jgi:YebC/PmpR family DNA-binding regulatory protein
MSGHSKWSTIKRKKGAKDTKRGKVFTQLIREISIAARLGGGDPHANPRLRLAMGKARATNMPKENIERAIKKGTGELEGESYEEIRYEGYGPAGVAVIVDTLTDNRNRTVGEVRQIFGKHAGNLGASGCVAYLFDRAGVLELDREGVDAEALMEAAIEAGAEDVIEDEETVRVQTAPEDFAGVKEALEATGFHAASAEIQMLPQTTVTVTGKDAQTVLKLFEALDEHEDVRGVYANFDISEEELQKAAEAG